ncbi:MAG: transposase, partial [Bacteroidota bacterium]
MTIKRRRNSLRLKGFDYSEPGGYFVTICTYERRCVLGEVADGRMILSDEGKAVENAWKQIPDHFENTKLDVFQIMPNHVHGIIEIKEPNHVGARHVVPL